MAALYRKAMDGAYLVCVWLAGIALVLVSAVIPWAVFTRYVLNSAASWPEPAAVLLTVVLTFFGAAACYRLGIHMEGIAGYALSWRHGWSQCYGLAQGRSRRSRALKDSIASRWRSVRSTSSQPFSS
jgi:tripartite ATP-independent transporter DctQ subunit